MHLHLQLVFSTCSGLNSTKLLLLLVSFARQSLLLPFLILFGDLADLFFLDSLALKFFSILALQPRAYFRLLELPGFVLFSALC